MVKTVELIIDRGCPNVEVARAELRRALSDLELPLQWQEWDRESAEAPTYAREYGSPTVLVDGRDVVGEGTEADANCCRVYVGRDGRIRGAPSAEEIRDALVRD